MLIDQAIQLISAHGMGHGQAPRTCKSCSLRPPVRFSRSIRESNFSASPKCCPRCTPDVELEVGLLRRLEASKVGRTGRWVC